MCIVKPQILDSTIELRKGLKNTVSESDIGELYYVIMDCKVHLQISTGSI